MSNDNEINLKNFHRNKYIYVDFDEDKFNELAMKMRNNIKNIDIEMKEIKTNKKLVNDKLNQLDEDYENLLNIFNNKLK